MVRHQLFHCPYQGCSLGCRNTRVHRARYSWIGRQWKAKVRYLAQLMEEEKKDAVHLQVLQGSGILWPLQPIPARVIDQVPVAAIIPPPQPSMGRS